MVVCEEYERVLLDAWKEEEEEAERKKAEVSSCFDCKTDKLMASDGYVFMK